MEFFIITNTFSYIIKKNGDDVLLNGKEINLDMKYVEPDEKNDVIDVYNQLIEDGYDKNVATAKAALYFANYIETGESGTIEFLDTLILYLAGVIKLPVTNLAKKIIIEITDEFIIVNKNKIEFNPHQSVIVKYNYKKLLLFILSYCKS